jgi:F0F1-type ATP synthase epsilon subunit
VTVITQRAIPAEKIDAAAARTELEKVTSAKATGHEALAAREMAAEAARALVRTATRGR